MSSPTPIPPAPKGRGFFRGLGEIAEFLREAGLALIEVAIGHWPQPFRELRERPRKPKRTKGLVKKIAPFPTED